MFHLCNFNLPSVTLAPPRPPKLPLQEILAGLTPLERAFFTTLDEQLEKVENFYQARETELQARARVLKEQLEELGDHRKFIHVYFDNSLSV